MKKVLLISALLFLAFSLAFNEKKIKTEVKSINYNVESYKAYPMYSSANKELKFDSSIIEDPKDIEESINSKPCPMLMKVSPDFMLGYKDNLQTRIPRNVNRNSEYMNGFNLAARDMQNGVIRKLETYASN